jgi:hypothetical protein
MSWLILLAVIIIFVGLNSLKKHSKKSEPEAQEWAQADWMKAEWGRSKAKWGKPEWGKEVEPKKAETKPKYMDKFQLMNKSEKLLFDRLREATPALLVFSQVSMSQLFHITNDRKREQLKEIGKKSVDFLLCREDTSIVVAIELNGPTHAQESQIFSDNQKMNALKDAGIPLIIFKPGEIPEVPELRKVLAPHIVARKASEAERDERVKQAKFSKTSKN